MLGSLPLYLNLGSYFSFSMLVPSFHIATKCVDNCTLCDIIVFMRAKFCKLAEKAMPISSHQPAISRDIWVRMLEAQWLTLDLGGTSCRLHLTTGGQTIQAL